MATEPLALSKTWYKELEKSADGQFILLPIEMQARGYTYNEVAKSYLTFFQNEKNTRQSKLKLAQKFFKFIQILNRNRARQELGEEFFECFTIWLDNFADLQTKQDLIHLEALDIIGQALDKVKFVEDVISFDELQLRIKRIKKMQKREEIIDAGWSNFEVEYKKYNK